MTKKKAIDEARRRSKTDFSGPSHFYTKASLAWLWEQARIATLREAAKIAICDPFADVKILDRANALAKKSRAK